MRTYNVVKTALLLTLLATISFGAQQNPPPATWLLENHKVKKALVGVSKPVIEKIATLLSRNELYSIKFYTASGGDQKIFVEYSSSKSLKIIEFKGIPLGNFQTEAPNGILIFDVEKLYGEGLLLISPRRDKYTMIFEDLYTTSIKCINNKIIAIGHTADCQDSVERIISIDELKFRNVD